MKNLYNNNVFLLRQDFVMKNLLMKTKNITYKSKLKEAYSIFVNKKQGKTEYKGR